MQMLILGLIVLVSLFFRLPDLPADQNIAVLVGVAGVIATYYLAKLLFNWQIASLSSFLMAVSSWHVMVSRSAHWTEVASSTLFVAALYFFWKGLNQSHRSSFILAGIAIGFGFYTYSGSWVIFGILLISLGGFWHLLEKDFSHRKYIYTRNQQAWNIEIMVIISLLLAIPTLRNLAISDSLYIEGSLLLWPVSILLLAGFLRSLIKIFRHFGDHGHLSPVYVLILSWFGLGFIPMFMTPTIGTPMIPLILTPVIFILAGEGLWWFVETLENFYHTRDLHEKEISINHRYHYYLKESTIVTSFITMIFFLIISFYEYNKIFGA